MLEIDPHQRRALRASAHALNPVVIISQNGLSDSVLKEIDTCLSRHELIKIRVFSDEREIRDQYLQSICEKLEAAPVQHIGKLLVVWRPSPDDASTHAGLKSSMASRHGKAISRRNEPRRTKRSFQSGG
ncbi:YhbY family RNA-binding protein [Propionivibrio limicola]|uniref:YhbY family RNA-binding protein n=1 Tax=Propionivibrio limicola TaxID=167645 RepID=UPI001290F594|nr:YhbY family RNA-binding protein [Propionivibrio limicola]